MKFTRFTSPLLFALGSVLAFFASSSVVASPGQMIRLLLFFWGVLICLAIPIRWLLKDWNQTSIFLSILAVTIFSPPDMFIAQMTIVAAVFVISFAYLYIKKIRYRFYHATYALNLAACGFIILIVTGFLNQASTLSLADIPQITWKSREASFTPVTSDEMPDIYFIVLDGYGRLDILNEYYGYDNSEFLGYLSSKGFIIPPQARSNYSRTVLSVSSTLNMDFVSNLTPGLIDKGVHYWWLLHPLIVDNQAGRILKDIGYRTYSATTGWGPTDNPTTDVYYQPDPIVLSDLESVALFTTPLRVFQPILKKYAYIPSHDAHRGLILQNLDFLSAASQEPGHKFFFAHVIAPHPPFVFGENGEPLTPDYSYSFNDANDIGLTDEEYRAGYISQLKFLNMKLEEVIDGIIENSERPPIIILQADHGPGMFTDFTSVEGTCLKERYSAFAAYYLPGIKEGAIPDNITPVNLFRVIFNEYFGADYPLLPNLHYFTDNIYLFRNQDVTSLVDTCSID